ncbi:MAG: hypothetical protein E7A34_08135, partial [Leclercia adecarboxylata]|nr:hypothetical protein [Leclercia adecarboxylata]
VGHAKEIVQPKHGSLLNPGVKIQTNFQHSYLREMSFLPFRVSFPTLVTLALHRHTEQRFR